MLVHAYLNGESNSPKLVESLFQKVSKFLYFENNQTNWLIQIPKNINFIS